MMETTAVDDTTSDISKYKAVEIDNGNILFIPLRCLNDQDYLLLSDIQAMVPTATALLSNGKMIPFEIDTHSFLELVPKRVLVKETDVVWQVYSPDPPPHHQQRTIQLEHKFDQLIQRLDQLVLSSSSEQLSQQDNNSHSSVVDAEMNTTSPTTELSINQQQSQQQQQQQSGPTSSTPPLNSTSITSNRRSTSPPPAFTSSPCPIPITTNIIAPTSIISSTPSSPASTSSRSSSPTSLSSSSSRQPPPAIETETPTTPTTSDTTPRDNNMAGPSSSSTHTNMRDSPSSPPPPQHHHDLAAAPPPSYETSIFGTIQALTQHIRRFEHHIPNRHKSPRWLARRAGWLGYEPTTIEQVAYQLVQLEMALLWTAVTESWIQERETWLTLVASARTERHLAGALVNLERHTLVLDDAWQDIREGWTRDLLEVIVSVGF